MKMLTSNDTHDIICSGSGALPFIRFSLENISVNGTLTDKQNRQICFVFNSSFKSSISLSILFVCFADNFNQRHQIWKKTIVDTIDLRDFIYNLKTRKSNNGVVAFYVCKHKREKKKLILLC